MSREKQIEEMSQVVRDTIYRENESGFAEGFDALCTATEYLTEKITEALYNAGYCKQSEGEWKLHKDGSGTCSECHFTQKNIWDYDNYQHFCGHCGAKMRGGAG